MPVPTMLTLAKSWPVRTLPAPICAAMGSMTSRAFSPWSCATVKVRSVSGSGLVVLEGGGDEDGDVVEEAEFDGARVHDLGALGGHFQHFLVGDVVEAA